MSDETQHDETGKRPKRTVGEVHALRCADCARSDSSVEGIEPSSRVPIPPEALAGFPDGVPTPPGGRHSRRSFLVGSAIGTASIYSASRLTWEAVWGAASARAATPATETILVCIYLNGGNDGLNAIVPVSSSQYSGYVSQRQNIARVLGPSGGGRVGTTTMGGTGGTLAFANPLVSGSGNNGASAGLDTLYGDGSGGAGSDLAIFPAADYRPANLSHFESRDYWFAGALEEMATGWLGRWLDRYGSATNPLQAVSIDSSLSQSILTETAPVCAISDLTDTSFQLSGVNANKQVASLAAVAANPANIALTRSRAIYGETVQVSKQVSGLTGASTAAPGYPANSDLTTKLQLAATLLSAGLGTRIVTIDWGSFDTHGDQIGSQDPQLAVLSQALAAFKADLIARGIEQRVLTLVYSEFGRRIGSNDSLGTDHGAGGLVMVSGSSVLGGLAGEHPGVQGDENDNLVPITDFRTVYQALISEWLGGDPTAILPKGPFPGIQRYDGATRLLK
jgi:uncharacterized protein (DUF1501 family)